MSQQTAETVTIYADYVCPFCHLGYASLDQYREQRDAPLSVEWQPFDLRSGQRRPDGSIDHDVDTGKDEAYYEEARTNVERLAEKYDVEMVQTLSKDVDSYDAQRVGLRVQDEHPDAFASYHRGVFDALWSEGRDIGDVAVLEEIAADAGVPDGLVEDTLADPDSAERLDEAFQAAQGKRITGVPTFVYGDHAARGAVPPAQLRRLVEGVE
jgi:predicted DsbA family dithiol-disulfide isomerase